MMTYLTSLYTVAAHLAGEVVAILSTLQGWLLAVGGGSTTYWADYLYTNIPTATSLRGVLFGGRADRGAHAGFGSAHSVIAPSDTSASIGSRLCFIPQK